MFERKIEIPGPYHFDGVLERLDMDPLNVVNKTERSVRVPLYLQNQPFVYTVQAMGNVNHPSFIVSGTACERESIAQLTEIFQWAVPLGEIEQYFAKTDLKSVFQAHRGTPLILDFSLYHCLMRCIIHQQLNMKFAMTLTKRFADNFGELIDGVRFFPRPEIIAALDVAELRALSFSERKAEYCIDLSRKIVEGTLDLEGMRWVSDEEVAKQLLPLRGVGQWTVACFLLFGLGRQNLFPFADIGLQNALKIIYGLTEKPNLEQMKQYSASWSPYLSYASLYLWRMMEKRK